MRLWNLFNSDITDYSRIDENKSEKKNRFFSLKWNAIILLSLIFVVINTFFYQYNRNNLLQEFEHGREQAFTQNQSQLQSLINQSNLSLLQLAELIPSLHDLQTVLELGNKRLIANQLDSIWPKLEVQSQVESLSFINAAGELIHSRGANDIAAMLDENDFAEKVASAQTLEQPVFYVFCFKLCKQYGVIPLAVNGRVWGTMLISSSLSEIVMNFSKTANMDIAFLHDSIANTKPEQVLQVWSKGIKLLSNYSAMRPIVNNIAISVPFIDTLARGELVEINDKVFELRSYLLTDSNSLYVTYIEDVSENIANINLVTKDMFLTGIFALLFSELALLAVLWRPLSRLRNASDIVPLLAANAFSAARHALAKQRPGKYLKNEIDVLDENLFEVSHRLERLQNNVLQRNEALAVKMHELTREKEFIQNLLDTAQVFIVTQNPNGKINQSNRYIEVVGGYTQSDLQEKNFFELTMMEEDSKVLKLQFSQIFHGDQNSVKSESRFRCKEGEIRVVEWLHSRVESKNTGEYEILSVGLDLTERKAYEEEISWLADHDSLTGLLNRRRFQAILKNTLHRAKRYNHKVALLFLDLDNFKHINDTLGHQTGDFLIQTAAANLKLVLRESDFIARFGGDEFAILLPEVDEQGAIDVAEKVNKHLTRMHLPSLDRGHRTCSSVGIAMYPEHGVDDKELLANADLAMYQAKSKGGGGWHLFSRSDDMRKRFENQMFWRNKINDALSQNTFELHYQPIVDLSNNIVSHYEVLIRMREPDGKVILPAPFISVAEKTGLIHSIDHFVLETAVKEIQSRNMIGQRIKLAINLSAHSFSDQKLFDVLKRLLHSAQIDPTQLIFEITETAALSDLAAASEMIRKIQSLGCLFALDDFGVGFSSFYYLKELPVDYVKIDGSFIQKLPHNRNDQILVKAITEIAKEFGKKTIAEFVEDVETIELLKQYKVDYVQGFYVGTPEKQVA